MKNKGKGGKKFKKGKKSTQDFKRELRLKEEGEEYAQVGKMLGNGRLEAVCFDGTKKLGHIRGKMRKKVWINPGDIVLISVREFQEEKADVVHKYRTEESKELKRMGELPEITNIVEQTEGEEEITYDGDELGNIIDFDNI
eukprot:gb/GECH01011302.1/.p1 GENE.gb/GECH01011302.1/~~gb/GECH01011302.1/.p1  ORF type:complete len:141 (+),score=35.43 gb/GECH01011302.1/:1-423(+)